MQRYKMPLCCCCWPWIWEAELLKKHWEGCICFAVQMSRDFSRNPYSTIKVCCSPAVDNSFTYCPQLLYQRKRCSTAILKFPFRVHPVFFHTRTSLFPLPWRAFEPRKFILLWINWTPRCERSNCCNFDFYSRAAVLWYSTYSHLTQRHILFLEFQDCTYL